MIVASAAKNRKRVRSFRANSRELAPQHFGRNRHLIHTENEIGGGQRVFAMISLPNRSRAPVFSSSVSPIAP